MYGLDVDRTRSLSLNWRVGASRYIKIGHSPFDPLIDDLEGTDTAAKLGSWMAGSGEDVSRYSTKSEDYFSRTLAAVLPNVTFVEGATRLVVV